MPPKSKVTKEQIIQAGLTVVRRSGGDALGARALASLLQCSTQPIFSNFPTMDAVRQGVIEAAYGIYTDFTRRQMEDTAFPAYKLSGLAYIRFAQQERELFKLLFMRDRSAEPKEAFPDAFTGSMIDLAAHTADLDNHQATLFHMEMWIYVHGIASMIATGYLQWDEELISTMLSDAYHGLSARYHTKKEES